MAASSLSPAVCCGMLQQLYLSERKGPFPVVRQQPNLVIILPEIKQLFYSLLWTNLLHSGNHKKTISQFWVLGKASIDVQFKIQQYISKQLSFVFLRLTWFQCPHHNVLVQPLLSVLLPTDLCLLSLTLCVCFSFNDLFVQFLRRVQLQLVCSEAELETFAVVVLWAKPANGK